MENLIKNKINLLIVLAIALLIVTGLFLYLQPEGQNILTSKKSVTEKEFKLETQETADSVILSGFPKDLPMEPGSQVLQSYESNSGNGRLQSTKKFTSSLSVDAALERYTDFFKESDWVQTGDLSQASPVTLSKKDDTAMLVVTEDSENGTIVEVTILQKKE